MTQRKKAVAGYGQPFMDSRGYWNIQIANGMKRGRTVYKRIRCKTLDGLRRKQRDFETKRARGMRVEHGEKIPTVAAFLTDWLEQSVATRNRFRTYERYRGIVYQYLIPYLDPRNTRPLDELDRRHVQAMINELAQPDLPKRKKGLAPRTLRNLKAVLRRALNVAVQDGALIRNVAKGVDVPPEPSNKKRTFTPAEVRIFFAAIEGHWLKAIFWTALLMGLREGELCGLRIEDLDLDTARLHPYQAIQRQKRTAEKGKLTTVPLKTEASNEPLPVPAPLVSVLRAQLALLEDARKQEDWEEHGLLFPSRRGTPLEPRNLFRSFKVILAAVNKRADREKRPQDKLPDIPFHNLRHTCGTLLAEMNVHPRVIQAVLRHASYYTTMRYYVHTQEATQAAAVEDLSAMLVEPERAIELPAPKVPRERG